MAFIVHRDHAPGKFERTDFEQAVVEPEVEFTFGAMDHTLKIWPEAGLLMSH